MPHQDDLTPAPDSTLVLYRKYTSLGLRHIFFTIGSAFKNAVLEFRFIIFVVTAYIVAVELIIQNFTNRTSGVLSDYYSLYDIINGHLIPYFLHRVGPFLIATTCLGALWILYDQYIRKSNDELLTDKVLRYLKMLGDPERFSRLIMYTIIFMPFMTTFAAFKAVIPVLHPYTWDATFIAMDRALHGGIDPWHLTWAVFGSVEATAWLDKIYFSWFSVIFSVPIACVFLDPDRQRRQRFFTTHALLWIILGSILAVVFSSVGPCYFEPVYGSDGGFAPLMENLRTVNADTPLVALMLQDMLLETYHGLSGRYEGLSAMPSLHVAQAVLVACLVQSYGRIFAIVGWGYALAIMIGSVHLGWHYAIDGYFAAGLTIFIWWLLGKTLQGPSSNVPATRF